MPSALHLVPRRLCTCVALLLTTATLAHAQTSAPTYTSIVVFGDSLSDTGNVADLTQAKYAVRIPGPIADYTDGRFTDGTDTVPAAHNYTGVWIEQLAAMLPSKPAVKASLDGGANYAYGFAFTKGGTSTLTLGTTGLSVTVDNIGRQITNYLATKPHITAQTLFVVWGGANDVLNATSKDDVVKAAILDAANVQRLIDAGATRILVPTLPPLGAIPRLNGSPTTAVPATQASLLYDLNLTLGLSILQFLNASHHVQIVPLDIYTLFTKVITTPAAYGLTNVTASSQGNYTVDPDTYLFWDDLHPTTHGHNLIALDAAKTLGLTTTPQ